MWQYFWKDFVLVVGGFLSIVFIVLTAAELSFDSKEKGNPILTVKYDCRLAEISPDYPPMVKQLCREKISK